MDYMDTQLYAYKWEAEFDNGAVVEQKVGIAFADDIGRVPHIVDKLLCHCSEDYVRSMKIEKINVTNGTGFVLAEKLISSSNFTEEKY